MKNIHVLPTDKPSRFYFNNNDKCFQLCKVDKKSTPLKINQNIYITSDEEIKEGHYYYNERLNKVFQAIIKSGYNTVDKEFKIILTTDQDLIKDGVQAIDDEFLEWFVKNPSCEFVKVREKGNVHAIVKGVGIKSFNNGYKIIIPKEEPKTGSITECIKMSIDNQLNELEELKQETLEEAAFTAGEEAFKSFKKAILEANRFDYVCGFTAGAKWQQEHCEKELEVAKELFLSVCREKSKMYSEEEVVEILKRFNSLSTKIPIIRFFEQFKKK
jgi:hypothetical protein